MPYNSKLFARIQAALADTPKVEEKKMFSGITFMVDDKMCICVREHDLMVRTDPAKYDEFIKLPGVHPMEMKGKIMKGYMVVEEAALKSKTKLDNWIKHALDFNKVAKSSKKKKQ